MGDWAAAYSIIKHICSLCFWGFNGILMGFQMQTQSRWVHVRHRCCGLEALTKTHCWGFYFVECVQTHLISVSTALVSSSALMILNTNSLYCGISVCLGTYKLHSLKIFWRKVGNMQSVCLTFLIDSLRNSCQVWTPPLDHLLISTPSFPYLSSTWNKPGSEISRPHKLLSANQCLHQTPQNEVQPHTSHNLTSVKTFLP